MNADEPQLTAYALGELDPKAKADLESTLAQSPEGIAEIAATQALANRLRQEFAGQVSSGIGKERRQEVLRAWAGKKVIVPVWRRPSVLSAMAACLVVGMGAGLFLQSISFHRQLSRAQANNGPVRRPGLKIGLPAPDALPGEARGEFDPLHSLDLVPRVGSPLFAGVTPSSPVAGSESWSLPENPLQGRAAKGVVSVAPVTAIESDLDVLHLASSSSGKIGNKPTPNPGPSAALIAAGITPRTGSGRLFNDSNAQDPERGAFRRVTENPVSRVEVGANGLSFEELKSQLDSGKRPAKEEVVIERLLNDFEYEFPSLGKNKEGVLTVLEAAICPWAPEHRLVRLAVKPGGGAGREAGLRVEIEFNPTRVSAYRLIGSDRGAGPGSGFDSMSGAKAMTALYEIVPIGSGEGTKKPQAVGVGQVPLLMLKVWSKAAAKRPLQEVVLTDSGSSWKNSSVDFRFSAAVASFGMLLQESAFRGAASWESTLALAKAGVGADPDGRRAQLVGVVAKAQLLGR